MIFGGIDWKFLLCDGGGTTRYRIGFTSLVADGELAAGEMRGGEGSETPCTEFGVRAGMAVAAGAAEGGTGETEGDVAGGVSPGTASKPLMRCSLSA
jgi:hypothetical protein